MSNPTNWTVIFYEDARGVRPVDDWLSTLDAKSQTRLTRTIGLLEKYGIQIPVPHSRHLRGKLFELRVASGRRDYRVVYAAMVGRRFVLLHGFSKTTQKTPERELETAE